MRACALHDRRWVESGYLSAYLIKQGIADKSSVAIIFTVYGITVAIAAWLSARFPICGAAASDGCRLAIWAVFEIAFLVFA